jgi:lipopolysaccharide transport system ATP-binding protein
MTRTTISVENLGKEYVIGGREKGSETFREMIVSAAAAPFRRLKGLSGNVASEERIWALKDVSFDVKEGEVVGIIGRNGAGKSTLLKVLSRITAPTEGRVKISGRVSSLLEVGTGFHPELTGRENIYLNGAILGMSREEIIRKFDDIIEFSGVEKFLDTPVKRYSSGMSVRLAFAVAAHLEPDILIVDEVLAVGDAEFQRKCLGKMDDVARSGRTVLFVSHNMPAVEGLCPRCLLLECGRVVDDGATVQVLSTYYRAQRATERNVGDLISHRGRPAEVERLMKYLEWLAQ